MLLMWMRMRRCTGMSAKAAIVPSGPSIAHMPHARAGLGADAGADHLVVLPERAVEQHAVGAGQPGAQRVGHARRSRGCRTARPPPAETRRPMVSPSSARPGSAPEASSRNSGTLPGTAKASTLQAERRAGGIRQRERPVERQRPAGHDGGVHRVEDRVGRQHRQRPVGTVEREGVTFPQGQQPGDGIDLGAGQHHGGDRRMADSPGAGPRMQRRGGARSAARRSGEAFSSTQRSPSAETASEAWVRAGAAGSPARARRQPGAGGIPLRKATAGGSAQDDGLKAGGLKAGAWSMARRSGRPGGRGGGAGHGVLLRAAAAGRVGRRCRAAAGGGQPRRNADGGGCCRAIPMTRARELPPQQPRTAKAPPPVDPATGPRHAITCVRAIRGTPGRPPDSADLGAGVAVDFESKRDLGHARLLPGHVSLHCGGDRP